MAGVRALAKKEILRAAELFQGPWAKRNRALLLLQYYTGRRITQILSLDMRDVIVPDPDNPPYGRIVDEIYFRRKFTKGKKRGENYPLNPAAKKALATWVHDERRKAVSPDSNSPLFPSRTGSRLTRNAASSIYINIFRKAGFPGRLGTHSLRKAFGIRCYEASGNNIYVAQAALGHDRPENTEKYIPPDSKKIKRIILEEL